MAQSILEDALSSLSGGTSATTGWYSTRTGDDDDDDKYFVDMETNNCPAMAGYTADGKKDTRPLFETTIEEAMALDRDLASQGFDDYNKLYFENDDGKLRKKYLRTKNKKACIPYNPRPRQQNQGGRPTFEQTVREVEAASQRLGLVTSNLMEAVRSKAQKQRAAEVARKLKEKVQDQAIDRKYGPDAMFKPHSQYGCDPQGDNPNQAWDTQFGSPQQPKRPELRPTQAEKDMDRWQRSTMVEIDGQPRCVQPSYKVNGRYVTDSYPASYHDLVKLMDIQSEPSYPKDDKDPRHPMDATKLYARSAFCAAALDDDACTDKGPAPLGGELPEGTCVLKDDARTGDKVCVPKEVDDANTTDNAFGDDPLGEWYADFYRREKQLLNNDPYVRRASQRPRKNLNGETIQTSAARVQVRGSARNTAAPAA